MSRRLRLSKGQTTLIDDEDYPLLTRYKWHLTANGAVQGSIPTGRRGSKHILMHRMIMNAPPNVQVDHKNGDRLDNRKENLRLCNNAENNRNVGLRKKKGRTSPYKGVSWCKNTNKWRAGITLNYRWIHLGRFIDPKEAALAYDNAAMLYFGEFSRTNF